MANVDDAEIEAVSIEVARAVWSAILVSRDVAKACGLIDEAAQGNLIATIAKLVRVMRRH